MSGHTSELWWIQLERVQRNQLTSVLQNQRARTSVLKGIFLWYLRVDQLFGIVWSVQLWLKVPIKVRSILGPWSSSVCRESLYHFVHHSLKIPQQEILPELEILPKLEFVITRVGFAGDIT